MKSGRLAGKVAVITGAAGALGRQMAATFAEEGAAVLAADLDGAGARHLADELRDRGGEAAAVAVDVTREADTCRMIASAEDRWGAVDVLVTAAGVAKPELDTDLGRFEVETWEHILAVNLRGVFLSSKAAVPAMLHAGGGSVIQIASIAALKAVPLAGYAYTASKGGVVALTRALASAHAAQGVRVNAVCPGLIETPLSAGLERDAATWDRITAAYPLGRLGTPRDVAGLALFLASDEAAWITGAVFPVDGGRTA